MTAPNTLSLDARQIAMLQAMGVHVWATDAPAAPQQSTPASVPPAAPVLATSQASIAAPSAAAPRAPVLPGTDTAHLDWAGLQAAVRECSACGLCQHRTQTVFGTGSPGIDACTPPQVKWLIVGEAPGEQEDLQGEPFVGPAGKLLDQMLRAVGLSRQREEGGGVYIVNTLKCRPPANRNPQPQELVQCAPWLARQIELLQPQLILALGRFAAQSLLRDVPGIEQMPLGKLRGQVHRAHGRPVVVSYHPAYLLRSPGEKAKAWEDWVLATHTPKP